LGRSFRFLGGDEFGCDGGGELEAAVGLVVGRRDVEVVEEVRQFGFAVAGEGGAQVGHGVEHRLDFVGPGAGRAVDFQVADRFGDRFAAGAEFLDPAGGEGDDGVVGVLALLEAEGLAVQRAVDVGELALETVALVVVLAPDRSLGVGELKAQEPEAVGPAYARPSATCRLRSPSPRWSGRSPRYAPCEPYVEVRCLPEPLCQPA
jgi:hypothetical protein